MAFGEREEEEEEEEEEYLSKAFFLTTLSFKVLSRTRLCACKKACKKELRTQISKTLSFFVLTTYHHELKNRKRRKSTNREYQQRILSEKKEERKEITADATRLILLRPKNHFISLSKKLHADLYVTRDEAIFFVCVFALCSVNSSAIFRSPRSLASR